MLRKGGKNERRRRYSQASMSWRCPPTDLAGSLQAELTSPPTKRQKIDLNEELSASISSGHCSWRSSGEDCTWLTGADTQSRLPRDETEAVQTAAHSDQAHNGDGELDRWQLRAAGITFTDGLHDLKAWEVDFQRHRAPFWYRRPKKYRPGSKAPREYRSQVRLLYSDVPYPVRKPDLVEEEKQQEHREKWVDDLV